MRRSFVVALCATGLLGHSVFAGADSTLCRDLCHYRDVELAWQYDAAFKTYEVSADHFKMLQDQRRDLMSSPQWSTSDARLASAELLVVVKTTCDLMLGVLKLNPAVTLPTRVVSAAQIKAIDITNKSIKGVKALQTAVDQGVEASAYKQFVAELNPILLALKTLDDFKANIDKMSQLGIDRDQLRTEVSSVLNLVNANLEKHNRIVQNNAMRLQDLNEVVRGIDDFLLAHDCSRYCTNSQENARERKEAKATGGWAPTAAVEEALGPGQFYVYLTYSVGNTTVFSRPIRCNGFEDPLTKGKVEFATALEQQYPHLAATVRQDIANKSMRLKMNYSAPANTDLLKTPASTDRAMREHEASILARVSRLPGTPPNFLYIK